MRYLCLGSYNGSAYQGWQKQINTPTIQGSIEEVLSKFFDQEINIYASGRTDTGVHAKGQTFHFDLDKDDLDFNRFLYSINQMLPKDIAILDIKPVDKDFHARFSAKGKEYRYFISYKQKDVFENALKYNCLLSFDDDLFEKTLTYFIGKHNFMNFTSKEEDEEGFIREIYDIKVIDNKVDEIEIIFKGNGFMRYMIRYLVGTALAVAMNKIGLDEVKTLLETNERKIVSYKAPAEGLYLMSVLY